MSLDSLLFPSFVPKEEVYQFLLHRDLIHRTQVHILRSKECRIKVTPDRELVERKLERPQGEHWGGLSKDALLGCLLGLWGKDISLR